MKKIILAIALLALSFTVVYGNSEAKILWGEGNSNYINGNYNGAVRAYEAVSENGYESSRLYYNLGNAYFKAGNLGRAVLNYYKAQRLAPYDRDIEYNLAVANGYVKDKIDVMPEFPLTKWMNAWRATLDSNAWAVLSLLFLALTLGCALLFFISERGKWRKTGFFAGVACVVLCVISLVFAGLEKKEMTNASDAVILSQSVSVKSAPEQNGSDLFIIHEGTKVDVLASYGDWYEIMIADGNKGWLPVSDMELIK